MKQIMIIDGYNLLYQFPELRKKMERDLEGARQDLLFRLSAYAEKSSFEIIVVFDGDERVKDDQVPVQNLQVIFSVLPEKADPLIRRLILEKVDQGYTTVITSDREIIDDARMCGVAVIASQTFANMHLGMYVREEEKKYDHPMNRDELDEWTRLFQDKQKRNGE